MRNTLVHYSVLTVIISGLLFRPFQFPNFEASLAFHFNPFFLFNDFKLRLRVVQALRHHLVCHCILGARNGDLHV